MVHRSVVGNGDAALGGSSSDLLEGDGALNLRTAAADDRAAFGNEVTFAGALLRNLTYSFYLVETNAKNNLAGAKNMPGLSFSINPDVVNAGNAVALEYVPNNSQFDVAGINPFTDPIANWGLTGDYFNAANLADERCGTTGARCTWTEVKAVLGQDAAITTGIQFFHTGAAFSGAVDLFNLNSLSFDFEPGGVVAMGETARKASKWIPENRK